MPYAAETDPLCYPGTTVLINLLDIADQLESEDARFLLADPGSPTMVRDGGDGSALYVLMPMRV